MAHELCCGDWGNFVALWSDPSNPPNPIGTNACACADVPYGDVDGSGAADLDDLTCMVDALSGLANCIDP